MSTPDFSKLLSRPADQAERPKAIPVGTYLAVITGFEYGTSKEKKTPFVRFFLRPLQAQDDVDMEALNEAGGLEKERKLRTEFYFTEDSEWRLREFLEAHLKMDTTGRSWGELVPDTVNKQVGIYVQHVISDRDPMHPMAVCDRTLALD